ncbi:MAG: DUF72 domain-containing protein [Armatimonadetes bacterium]|nr:DUF72 domain-containing protein [Armatimonadota bacterium]
MGEEGQIHIGTSGWSYQHWRGVFYPSDLPSHRWIEFYARHFGTVEINATFYRLPQAKTFDGWRQKAPPGFLYAVKASRYLTHIKRLLDPAAPLELLLSRARRLGPHLGPILYQLPPGLGCDVPRLRAFIGALPRDFHHVFEFRNRSWCTEEIRWLLAETAMNFCIHDMHGFDCPLWVTGPLAYVRFHGPSAIKYAGRYDLEHLRLWAERIEAFRRADRDVYAYFNNDVEGHAVTNARELQELLGVRPLLAAE